MFTVEEVDMIRKLARKLPPKGSDPPSKSQMESLVEQAERCHVEEVCMNLDVRAFDDKLGDRWIAGEANSGVTVQDGDNGDEGSAPRLNVLAEDIKKLLCCIWASPERSPEEKRLDAANALRYLNKLRGQPTELSCRSLKAWQRMEEG
jgi:hypothetical protein